MGALQTAQADMPEFPVEQNVPMADLPPWVQELWPFGKILPGLAQARWNTLPESKPGTPITVVFNIVFPHAL